MYFVISETHRKKQITSKIQLPMKNPTALTFGGPKYDILYVTSSANDLNFNTLAKSGSANAPAGDLLKITGLGVTGVRSYRPAL